MVHVDFFSPPKAFECKGFVNQIAPTQHVGCNAFCETSLSVPKNERLSQAPAAELWDGVRHFTGLDCGQPDSGTEPCASGHYLSFRWEVGTADVLLVRTYVGPCIPPNTE